MAFQDPFWLAEPPRHVASFEHYNPGVTIRVGRRAVRLCCACQHHVGCLAQVMPPVKVVLQDYYGQLVSTASGWMCAVSSMGASGIGSLSGGKAITDRGTATFDDLIVTGVSPSRQCSCSRNMILQASMPHACSMAGYAAPDAPPISLP